MRNGADYVMTLNNDTIATDTFIEEMVNWANKKPDALLGALAVDSGSKKIIYGGNRVDWVFHQDTNLLTELKEEEKKGIHSVSYFPGRGLWIPTKVFKKIGLFDVKKFPHYAADYDFTLVAKRAGFEIYCNYDAKLYTYPEASGAAELKKKKTFKNYYNHLFGIKGAGNLKVFTQYTLKNCPKALIPTYLLQGYTRRLLGYWLK
jgi:GT2 family glycosyltransferase